MAAASYEIRLLGGFSVLSGGRVLIDRAWPRKKAQALIKLLALQPGRYLLREQVFESLWPGLAPDAAANNLRQNVHYIRRACADSGLQELVSLNGQRVELAAADVDIDRFRTALDRARARKDGRSYEEALALCPGELLPDDVYEEWTEAARRQLRELHEHALLEASALHEAAGDLDRAAERLRRVLELEPALEEAHRGLMRLYAATGERDRALRQHQTCRDVLQGELGVAPSAETAALLRKIESGTASARPSLSHRGARGRPRRWFAALAAGGATLLIGGIASLVLIPTGLLGGSADGDVLDVQFTHVGESVGTITGNCVTEDVHAQGDYSGEVSGDLAGTLVGGGRGVFTAADGCATGQLLTTYTFTDSEGDQLFITEDYDGPVDTELTSSGQQAHVRANVPDARETITGGTGGYQSATGSGTCVLLTTGEVTLGSTEYRAYWQSDCTMVINLSD